MESHVKRVGGKRFLAVLAAIVLAAMGISRGYAASEIPSAEFTGLPSNTGCTGGSYAIPTTYNVPNLSRVAGALYVGGLGRVDGYNQNTDRTDMGFYGFFVDPISVPSGTRFTAILTTYSGPKPSTDAVYRTTLVFECGTGNQLSLVSGPFSGGNVPVMPLWALALLGLLVAVYGGLRVRRQSVG